MQRYLYARDKLAVRMADEKTTAFDDYLFFLLIYYALQILLQLKKSILKNYLSNKIVSRKKFNTGIFFCFLISFFRQRTTIYLLYFQIIPCRTN